MVAEASKLETPSCGERLCHQYTHILVNNSSQKQLSYYVSQSHGITLLIILETLKINRKYINSFSTFFTVI